MRKIELNGVKLKVRLRQYEKGGIINLTAETPDGFEWYILMISANGRIERNGGVGEGTGFVLEGNGQVQVE